MPRARRSFRWWAGITLWVLLASLWPLSYVVPLCFNAGPLSVLRPSFDDMPGLGNVVGNYNGCVLLLRGRLVECRPIPLAPSEKGETRWYLEDWYGGRRCGWGIRRWGLSTSPVRFEQTGIIFPAWFLSAPAMVTLLMLLARLRKTASAPLPRL
jgi:hypothetical protein